MSVKSVKEKIKKRNQASIALLISIIIVFSSLFIFSNISRDGLINVKIASDFTIKRVTIPMIRSDLSGIDNITLEADELYDKLALGIIFFDAIISNQTYIESVKELNEGIKNMDMENNISHLVYLITPDTIQEYRPRDFFLKYPKGNKISHMLFVLKVSKTDYLDSFIFYFFVFKDSENILRTFGDQKIILKINSLYFNESSYEDHYNYFSNKTTNIPSNTPYMVEYEIEKRQMTINDYFREG